MNTDIQTYADLQPGTKFISLPVEYEHNHDGRGYYVFEKLDSQFAVRVHTNDKCKMNPDMKVLVVYA